MTRATSPVHRPGYLTGSGLVADIGPLLPSQGCRLPSPDRGMRYDARTSSPNRKRRWAPSSDTEGERMWDQLICPPRESRGASPSAGAGDESSSVRIGWENLFRNPEQSREQGQVARYEQSATFPRGATAELAGTAISGSVPTPEQEQKTEHESNLKPAAKQEIEPEQHQELEPTPGVEPKPEPEPEPEPEPTFDIKELAPEAAAAVQYLREVPRFAKLTDAAMLHVAMKMQLLNFDSQQVIFRKGDRGSTFYMIVSGSVNVEQQGKRDLGARNCFEHAALLS
eukprot:COSAG02_NODE_14704_length_1245_cov_0.936300_1_plen_282_part_10